MPSLAAFQRDFVRAATGARSPLRQQPGFAVYRNTSVHAAISALAASYRTVERLIGHGGFAALALRYARAIRPASPVLSDYGASLPEWLDVQPMLASSPFLADVARIDWLCLEAHTAADASPFGGSARRDSAPDSWMHRKVVLHPAARLAWFRSPAATIWLAADGEHSEVEAEWVPEGVLITRPDGAVQVTRIDAATHRLLAGLRIGESVGSAACAAAALYGAPHGRV